MRFLVRKLDGIIRRSIGVFEFNQDANCLLRLQVTRAPRPVRLPDLVLEEGDSVLQLHFWNEHLPPIPSSGPTLAWAIRFQRLLVWSFRGIAQQIGCDPLLAGVRAVGGVLALLPSDDNSAGFHLIHRLGFAVLPYRSPLGQFGEFWENFYSWLLLWTYNPVSLASHRLFQMRRYEIWMAKDEFLNRYCY